MSMYKSHVYVIILDLAISFKPIILSKYYAC